MASPWRHWSARPGAVSLLCCCAGSAIAIASQGDGLLAGERRLGNGAAGNSEPCLSLPCSVQWWWWLSLHVMRFSSASPWNFLYDPPPRPLEATCRRPEADASFKSTMQARSTDWVALSNGRGQIARSPAVKDSKRSNKPLELSYLSDLAPSHPTRLPLDCCAVVATGRPSCSSRHASAHTAKRSSSQGPTSALRFNYHRGPLSFVLLFQSQFQSLM